MNRRRTLLVAFLAGAVVVCVLAVPAVHWRLAGRVRGESFYQGRPVSYWAGEIGLLSCGYDLTGPVPAVECYRADCLLPTVRRRLGWVVRSRLLAESEVPLGQGDPDALTVLLALLRGPDEQTRVHAAWGLARVGAPAREAVPELTALAARTPKDILSVTSGSALRYIEVERRPAEGVGR